MAGRDPSIIMNTMGSPGFKVLPERRPLTHSAGNLSKYGVSPSSDIEYDGDTTVDGSNSRKFTSMQYDLDGNLLDSVMTHDDIQS